MKAELTYSGSVKNVYRLGDKNLFEFSDRYSIFDWGEMPDHLDHKGEALAVMGALFFEVMSKNSIKHHFVSLTDKTGNDFETLIPTKFMKVENVTVARPTVNDDGNYEYNHYQTRPSFGLVPLEVMFRFGASKGSSLLTRVEKQPGLLKQWNLKSLHEGMRFQTPIIDFSTKLEKSDRYLTHSEAQELAGLTNNEFAKLIQLNERVATILGDLCQSLKLELWDGKTEWSFIPGKTSERDFMLVDTIGLDELRIEAEGESLSKEFLRQFYKKSSWYNELAEAKQYKSDFKSHVKTTPEQLPQTIKYRAESLYLSFTNDLAFYLKGTRPFGEAHTLSKWLELAK